MKRVPVTKVGMEMLKQELEELKSKRPKIIAAIAEARAHGDLRENAEYNAAKEEQGLTEARIRHIEEKLSMAEVVDPKTLNHQGRVVFGATVSICNVETEEEFRYQIVGEDEADIKQNKISINSPIARSIIGKEQGEIILVQAPGGSLEYEIMTIDYI